MLIDNKIQVLKKSRRKRRLCRLDSSDDPCVVKRIGHPSEAKDRACPKGKEVPTKAPSPNRNQPQYQKDVQRARRKKRCTPRIKAPGALNTRDIPTNVFGEDNTGQTNPNQFKLFFDLSP